ncbi:MAG TPA: hypothetical protein VHF89_06805 [Solirubrobacteraceae bacterium]|nr:hypothetical protein [Solirubrobacteraceae bacterium]
MRLPVVVATLVLLLPAASANAATVIWPADGDTIPATPAITVGEVSSYVNYEFSRTPDLMQAGPDAGQFVDPAKQAFLGFPQDGVVPYEGSPLKPGPHFFHVQDGDSREWTRVIRVIVRDEVPVLAGWSLTARRVASRKSCKKRRVALSGKVRYIDNAEDDEELRVGLPVSAGGARIGRITAVGQSGTADVAGVVCTSSKRLTVGLSLRDAAGHVTIGPSRVVPVS